MKSTPAITGVLPVLQMPYHEDGSIDYDVLSREIDHVIAAGSDGVVLALASELVRLSHDERLELSHRIPEMAAGRCTVTISVGAETSRGAAEYARIAERGGAHAVMAIPPVATHVPEKGIFEYYKAIHDAVSIPVVVQDASGYLGHSLSVDLQARLRSELGPRMYFKPEAQPIGPTLTRLQVALNGEAVVFEGSGGLQLVDSHRRGISGTMPGCDLIHGIVEIWRALERGDDARAYEVYFPLSSLVLLETASLDAFLTIEKHFLVKQGIFKNTIVREPVAYSLDNESTAEIERIYVYYQRALGRG